MDLTVVPIVKPDAANLHGAGKERGMQPRNRALSGTSGRGERNRP